MKKYLCKTIAVLISLVLLVGLLPMGAIALDDEWVFTSITNDGATVSTGNGLDSADDRDITMTLAHSVSTLDLTTGWHTSIYSSTIGFASITSYKNHTTNLVVDSASAGDVVDAAVTYYLATDTLHENPLTTTYFITIEQADYQAPTFTGTIQKPAEIAPPTTPTDTVIFDSTEFSSLYTPYDGGAISDISIDFTDTSCGYLVYDSSAYISGTKIPITDIDTKLTFLATDGGTENYIVHAYGTSTEPADAQIGSVPLIITVTEITPPSGLGIITKSIATSDTYPFQSSDFTCTPNNGTVSHITIYPDATTAGTWANDGTGFDETTPSSTFAVTDIGDMTFTATTVGIATFKWTATNEAGESAKSGECTITVADAGAPSFTGTGAITKSIYKGVSYQFASTDFTSQYDLHNGSFDNVTITFPDPLTGTWKYDGTDISSGDTLPITSEANLAKLSFTASSACTAIFDWSVTNSVGTKTDGTGTITVYNSTSTVSYTATAGTTVTFSQTGLTNLNAKCIAATTTGLAATGSVTFTAPSSSYGTLRYNYVSASSPGTPVTGTYTCALANLSKMAFVPASGSITSVNIPFTGTSATGSTFSGTVKITYSTTLNVPYTTAANTYVTFSSADFYSKFYTATGGKTLSYVTFSPLPAYYNGTLYKDYATYGTYYPVAAGSAYHYASTTPLISSVSFMPYTNYTGTVTINFTAYATDLSAYSGTVTITVGSSGTVTYTTAKNTPVAFNAYDFYSACSAATSQALNYITFSSVYSSAGRIYYGSSYASAGTRYYYSASSSWYIGNLKFVPTTNYTGTATFAFSGASAYGAAFSGTVTITVGSSGTVTYTTAKNTPVTFNTYDFYSACSAATNEALNYITFSSVYASAGRIYYGSSYASTGTPYYYSASSSSYIGNLKFVPTTNYTGTATFAFSGASAYGKAFTGTVTITVGASGNVTYTTAKNTPVTFSASDFSTAFNAATNKTLSTVKFTLPSSSAGKLYYNYSTSTGTGSTVYASTAYKVSGSPNISTVTFVPATNKTGTVTFNYTGYPTYTGTTYTGTVTITVGSSGNVTYTTAKNTPVTFSASDFSTAFNAATNKTLSTVKFTLPSSSAGKLYYNHSTSTGTGSTVYASTAYKVSGSPNISTVTFVPAANKTGTVTFNYTGYPTYTGTTYTGTVTITVGGDVENITLTTKEDTALSFSADDFKSVFSDATGLTLSHVKFTLPSTSYGRLFYQYTGDPSASTAVSAGYSYYVSASPYLYQVTFMPAANYTGTVTLNYTGYDSSGTSVSGKIIITVSPVTGSSFFNDVGASYDWAADAIDYLYQDGVVKGTGTKTYSPAVNISRGDFILMLYRALGFTGTPSSMFSDVPSGSYYYTAIAAAKAKGIAEGSGNAFRPDDSLTRQDAMVLIYRALKAMGRSLPEGSSSDLGGFNDTSKLSDYALTAVATLVKAGIIKGSNSNINPLGNMTRAEMAVVIYRIV